jgi:Pin2-interacting protein X1
MSQKFKDKVLAGSGFSNRKVESDYAMKLMMKMGWSEGKGLGKKDDGQTECL